MASGSSGHGSKARGAGGAPSGAAAAPFPDSALPRARRLANLPAVDLVGHLVNRNRSSDFADVALELITRERKSAGAVARARAAEEAAARLRGEMVARERVAAAVEERLQAEIREWKRRAAEAEACLEAAYAGGRDDDISKEHGDAPPSRWSLTLWPGGYVLTDEEEEAPPLQVASGKRKEKAVASSPIKLSKKFKLRRARGGGSCSNAVPELEADTSAEAEAEKDPWLAWEEAQDALAILPGAGSGWCDLHDAPKETGTKQGSVGEHDQRSEDKIGGEPPEGPAQNPVALAAVTPPAGVEEAIASRGGAVPEPEEASEESNMTETDRLLRNKGPIFRMVFKALKEKERQATLASASQPKNIRWWLHAPVRDGDKGAPQQ